MRNLALGMKGMMYHVDMQASLGNEGSDGHVRRQEDSQQGDVARHGGASSQRHEVVPVVHIGQGCMRCAGLVTTAQGLDQHLPQMQKLLPAATSASSNSNRNNGTSNHENDREMM